MTDQNFTVARDRSDMLLQIEINVCMETFPAISHSCICTRWLSSDCTRKHTFALGIDEVTKIQQKTKVSRKYMAPSAYTSTALPGRAVYLQGAQINPGCT